MKRLSWLAIVALVCKCTLIGRGQPTCEVLQGLISQLAIRPTAADFGEWIGRTFGIKEGAVRSHPGLDGRTLVEWEKGVLECWALLDGERLDQIQVTNVRSVKSTEEVIACFGEPTAYLARYLTSPEGPYLILELVFPEYGLYARGYLWPGGHNDAPPAITGSFGLEEYRLVPVGSVDSVVSAVYEELPVRDPAEYARHFRPWPGSWEAVVIEDWYGEHQSERW